MSHCARSLLHQHTLQSQDPSAVHIILLLSSRSYYPCQTVPHWAVQQQATALDPNVDRCITFLHIPAFIRDVQTATAVECQVEGPIVVLT